MATTVLSDISRQGVSAFDSGATSVSPPTIDITNAVITANSGGANIIVSPPSGLVAGDIWVVARTQDVNNDGFITPSGWTQLGTGVQNTGDTQYSAVYAKTATGSETSVQFNTSGVSRPGVYSSVRIYGTSGIDTFVEFMTADSAGSSTISLAGASVTTTQNTESILFIASTDFGGTSNVVFQSPNGFNTAKSLHDGSYSALALASGSANTAGTYTSAGATATIQGAGSGAGAVWLIAFNSSGTSVPLNNIDSFNTRTGDVTLSVTDITSALSSSPVPKASNITGSASGSIPYQTAADTTTKLDIGSNSQVLTVVSGVPGWSTISTKPTLTLTRANATTTAETVVARWAIPANSIAALTSLSIAVRHQTAGTGTIAWKLRIGAAGTTADTLLATITTSAAQVANAQGGAYFTVEFPTTTTAIGSGYAVMQAAVLGTTTAAATTATIVPTGIVYVSVTVTCSAAAANVTQACCATWGD